MQKSNLFRAIICFHLVFTFPLAVCAQSASGIQSVTLDESIEQALENNRARHVSRYAVAMAEAQHKQALAGYWPQVSATGGYAIEDDDPNFIFPSSTISLPNGGTIGITFPSRSGTVTVPVNEIQVPVQDVKLMDREW